METIKDTKNERGRNEHYEQAEQKFYEVLTESLGDNLSCYIVTGSLGRHDVVPGWSDIDTLIIVKNYDEATFQAIADAQEKNNSGIHIGVTAYSEAEFKRSEIFCDAKTQRAIEFLRNGILKPKYTNFSPDADIDLLEPKHDVMEMYDVVDLTRCLVELKRGITNFAAGGERMAFKNMSTICKILLYHRGILAESYDKAITGALESLGYPGTLPHIDDVSSEESRFSAEERKQMYIDFISWLQDNLFYDAEKFTAKSVSHKST